jgi:hypothetical protein
LRETGDSTIERRIELMRRIVMVGIGCLALLGSGCGKDCKSACSKLYDECKLFITTVGGGQVSKDECISQCDGLSKKSDFVSCLHDTACTDTSKMESCVLNAQ